jgi:hypothetical protein
MSGLRISCNAALAAVKLKQKLRASPKTKIDAEAWDARRNAGDIRGRCVKFPTAGGRNCVGPSPGTANMNGFPFGHKWRWRQRVGDRSRGNNNLSGICGDRNFRADPCVG